MYVYVVTFLSMELMKSKKRLVVVFTVQHKSWIVEILIKFLLHMKPSCNQSVKVIATQQNFIQASFIKVCSIKRLCCMVLNSTSMCMYNFIRNLNTLNLYLCVYIYLLTKKAYSYQLINHQQNLIIVCVRTIYTNNTVLKLLLNFFPRIQKPRGHMSILAGLCFTPILLNRCSHF